jgi:hypothetical protein
MSEERFSQEVVQRHPKALKASLKSFEINHQNWESLAVDRPSWWRLTYDGASHTKLKGKILQKTAKEDKQGQLSKL